MLLRATQRARFALTLGASIASVVGCSFTSLDKYFECDPATQKCGAGAPSSAGTGGTAGADPGNAGNGGTAGNGGNPATDGGTAGVQMNPDGGAGEAGSAGAIGAGPGEACGVGVPCAVGTCYRALCGDAFEVVQYQDTPDPKDNAPDAAKWIRFQFRILNRTADMDPTPLSALKIRYYYTPEDVTSEFQVLTTSAPPANSSDVLHAFGVTQGIPSSTYLEVGFDANAGPLASGMMTGLVRVGVHDQNFGPGTFTEGDDWSYLHVLTGSPNPHITLYLNGVLVSGVAPP